LPILRKALIFLHPLSEDVYVIRCLNMGLLCIW